jgi:hypothetical protein
MRNELNELMCDYPDCSEVAKHSCDSCENWFCVDHGTKGGDRQVQDVGAVAYPACCWNCGGYNADAKGHPDD